MDSYTYRDSARSPGDRIWSSRDDPRVKEERDSFYRGRSPGTFRLPPEYILNAPGSG